MQMVVQINSVDNTELQAACAVTDATARFESINAIQNVQDQFIHNWQWMESKLITVIWGHGSGGILMPFSCHLSSVPHLFALLTAATHQEGVVTPQCTWLFLFIWSWWCLSLHFSCPSCVSWELEVSDQMRAVLEVFLSSFSWWSYTLEGFSLHLIESFLMKRKVSVCPPDQPPESRRLPAWPSVQCFRQLESPLPQASSTSRTLISVSTSHIPVPGRPLGPMAVSV